MSLEVIPNRLCRCYRLITSQATKGLQWPPSTSDFASILVHHGKSTVPPVVLVPAVALVRMWLASLAVLGPSAAGLKVGLHGGTHDEVTLRVHTRVQQAEVTADGVVSLVQIFTWICGTKWAHVTISYRNLLCEACFG